MAGEIQRPLVSVCIPTYNGARYLQDALDSASNQTLIEIEILCIDDGSSDGSIDLIRQHQSRDPRVVLLRNERNLGLVGNWNRCLEEARGEWIKFLFQDDWLTSTCLERMLDACDRDCRFVTCGRQVVAEEGSQAELVESLRATPLLARSNPDTRLSPDEYALLRATNFQENREGEPPCVMFHRDVPYQIGSFDPSFRQLCDLEYWLRTGTRFGLTIVGEDLANFRAHGTSTTSMNNKKRVNVTNIDKVLLIRKVQSDAAFENLRRSVPKRWLYVWLKSLLLSLAKMSAHREDAIFAKALKHDKELALLYRGAQVYSRFRPSGNPVRN